MNATDERLRTLGGGELPPPATMDQLRRRTARRRLRAAGAGSALAVVVLLGVLAAWPSPEAQRLDLTNPTGPEPAPSESRPTDPGSAPDATVPGSVPPGDPTGEPADGTIARAVPAPLVLAGAHGVTVHTDPPLDIEHITDEPAVVAYGLALDATMRPGLSSPLAVVDYVVFRAGGGVDDATPELADLRVWDGNAGGDGGTIWSLPAGPDVLGRDLLDAAVVDGVPLALVVERTSGVEPQATFERLVAVDLRDGGRPVLVARPAWESAHRQARLLPDGGIVGLMESEGEVDLVHWSTWLSGAGGLDEVVEIWRTPLGGSRDISLMLRDGEPLTVSAVDVGDADTQYPLESEVSLALFAYDPRTGVSTLSESVRLRPPHDELFPVGVPAFTEHHPCTDFADASSMVCGRGSLAPVVIDVHGDTVEVLDVSGAGVATMVRVPTPPR